MGQEREAAHQLSLNLSVEENKTEIPYIPVDTTAIGEARFMQMRFRWVEGANMFAIDKVRVLAKHWYGLDGGEPLLSKSVPTGEVMKRWREINKTMENINSHPVSQVEQRGFLHEIMNIAIIKIK